MEGIQKAIHGISKDWKMGFSGSSSPSSESRFFSGDGRTSGIAAALSSPDQSYLIATRNSRQVVSLLTCSKLCAFFFVAGIVVGYSLKRRVKRWASKLLRRLKDD